MSASTKGLEKKEHILECAKKLFAQKGYDGVSTRLLANESGTNLAMISYYFGSKEDMYKEILNKNLIHLRTDIEELKNPKLNPCEKLNLIVDLYVERFFTNTNMVQIVFKEISSNKREGLSRFVSAKMMDNFSLIESIIEDGFKKKLFKKTDIPLFIMTIFGTMMIYINGNYASFEMVGAKDTKEYLNTEHKERMKTYMRSLIKNQLSK
ncbi:MAG: hypothetical protein RL065_579 [Bacteroidota bacterium]|jgi:AcrR family transcriptional regulator